MRTFTVIILLFAVGCKKSTDPLDRYANNHIEATVISSSGDTTRYSFHGANAPMYISSGFLGSVSRFQAEGKTDAYTAKIRFGVDSNDTTNTIVSCAYYPGGTDPNSYSTEYLADPGTITFTTFSNNSAEGYFSAKCRRFSDSVLISGTFRGYYSN